MPPKTTRNLGKTLIEERKQRAQAAQDEKDRLQREFEQKHRNRPRGEVRGKTVVPQPRQKERGGRDEGNISKKDLRVYDYNEKDSPASMPPRPPAPTRFRNVDNISNAQRDVTGRQDRERSERRARRSIRGRGVPADEGGAVDGDPVGVNDDDEKDHVLPDLRDVVNLVDGPYKDLADYNPDAEMKTIYDELQENIKTKWAWYKWTAVQMKRLGTMIKACYTKPVNFNDKYGIVMYKHIVNALYKNVDTLNCFAAADKWLDLLRDDKVDAFIEKVRTTPAPIPNLEDSQSEVVAQWLQQPFFKSKYPRITDVIDKGFADWDKPDEEEEEEDDERPMDDDVVIDEREDEGVADPRLPNGRRVRVNIGEDENEAKGVVVPVVPANVVQENIVQLGDVINYLWNPLAAGNKKHFDDERAKYCKMAAEILANCRWQVSKKRETVDTVMNALSVLRANNIIKGKKFVGGNNTYLNFLEGKLNRFDRSSNTAAYLEKSNREKRKIESYVGRMRAIKNRMVAERRPDRAPAAAP